MSTESIIKDLEIVDSAHDTCKDVALKDKLSNGTEKETENIDLTEEEDKYENKNEKVDKERSDGKNVIEREDKHTTCSAQDGQSNPGEINKSVTNRSLLHETVEFIGDISCGTVKQKQTDYTLIITAEEDEELNVTAAEDVTNKVSSKSKTIKRKFLEKKVASRSIKKTLEKKREENKYVWVSNITKNIKAADLKKLFATHGKVTAAKIVTNGKTFFGYICLESAEMADICISNLNNTNFEDKKIIVSRQRPDIKSKVTKTEEVKRRSIVTPKKIEAPVEVEVSTIEVKVSSEGKTKQPAEEKYQEQGRTISRLKRELEETRNDLFRYKRRFNDCQRRLEVEQQKYRSLQKEMQRNNDQLRSERRRLNQDREQLDKKEKLEQIRYEADRALLNKELDECKRLRQHLQTKIDELSAKKKRKSRSPSPARRRSPILTHPKRLRHEQKQKRHEESTERNRTPPPPPKLTADPPIRARDRSSEIRPHYAPKNDKRSRLRRNTPTPRCHYPSSMHQGSSIRPLVPPAQHSKVPPWPTAYPEQAWRPQAGSSHPPTTQSYGYGSSYPPPPLAIPGREQYFYQEFGKSHGHYDVNRRY